MNKTDPKTLITIASPPPEPTDSPEPQRRRGRKPVEIPDDTRQEILDLHKFYGTRQIALRVGLSRKLVERVLEENGLCHSSQQAQDQSKLDPFRDLIKVRVRKHLTTTRILREIQQVGYQGHRTILGDHVRKLRTELTVEPKKSVKRRFETAVGLEMQMDWSPYCVSIAGCDTRIHVLGCLLAWSRKLYAYAFRDERQSTLLEGLSSAFTYFDGVAARLVVDNMATAVLGRIGPHHKVLWHQRFLDFSRHYGSEPFACKVNDPDRKGKKEKSFRLLEEDFIRGSEFDSIDELNERLRIWLDHTPLVANQRVHGTTRRVPNEAYELEREFLIRLPDQRFAVHQQEARVVDGDSTLSIRGTPYTVPATLANRSVAVHLFAEHFEVLDPHGRTAMSRRYVPDADKGRLVIDKTHYANLPRRPHGNSGSERLDEAFIRRFPELQNLVDGLKRRMKSLASIHLRAMLRLSDRYGQQAFLAAATRAQDFRRFDALAIERILEQAHPTVAAEVAAAEAIAPLSGRSPFALAEMDCGSLDSLASLDTAAPTTAHCPEDEPHDS